MPVKLSWTAAQDTQIRRLRAEGFGWDEVARVLGFSPWTVMARGRRIGARRPPPDTPPPPEDPRQEPLPAGHPRSWDALNAGTSLQGTAYPLPFFPR